MALTFDQKVAAQAGLLRSHVFSASDEFSAWGNDIASFRSIDPQNRFLDTTRLASGKPSLRFQCDPFKGSDTAGQWGCRFTAGPAPGTQFGAEEEFWYQYMYCVDRFMFEHNFQGNNGNFKLGMVGTGDTVECGIVSPVQSAHCRTTCTDLEIVTTNENWGYQYPQMYNACDGAPPGVAFSGLQGFVSDTPSDYTNQPRQPEPAPQADVCSHQYIGSNVPFGSFPTDFVMYQPGVHDYRPAFRNCRTWQEGLANPTDQVTRWATLTHHVQVGTFNGGTGTAGRYLNSHIEAWIHWMGDPVALKFIDHFKDLYAAPPQKYGRLWFTNYMTAKSAAEDHQSASSWYANVIIATQAIPLETADTATPSLALIRL